MQVQLQTARTPFIKFKNHIICNTSNFDEEELEYTGCVTKVAEAK